MGKLRPQYIYRLCISTISLISVFGDRPFSTTFKLTATGHPLSSLTRHEERPDFKKVEESMRTYNQSITNEGKTEGAAAAAEPVK